MEKQSLNSVFIVIPAYHEEKNIGRVLVDLTNYNYQIIVVNDGSNDRTAEIAKNHGALVLRHKINRGQGAALVTGTEFALRQGAEVVVHFDADGQFISSEIESLIEPIISNEVDLVLGSRFLKNTDEHGLGTQINTDNKMPFFKKYFILPIARLMNYFFTGLKLTDAHCGFRAMNRIAAEKIRIEQDGMAHNTEIVAQIKKLGLRWREVPVTVIYHKFGQGMGGGFKILKELLVKKLIK